VSNYKLVYKVKVLNKLTPLELKRVYYYFLFRKLPYKDQFYFRNQFSLIPLYSGIRLFVFNGRYWFKFKVSVQIPVSPYVPLCELSN